MTSQPRQPTLPRLDAPLAAPENDRGPSFVAVTALALVVALIAAVIGLSDKPSVQLVSMQSADADTDAVSELAQLQTEIIADAARAVAGTGSAEVEIGSQDGGGANQSGAAEFASEPTAVAVATPTPAEAAPAVPAVPAVAEQAASEEPALTEPTPEKDDVETESQPNEDESADAAVANDADDAAAPSADDADDGTTAEPAIEASNDVQGTGGGDVVADAPEVLTASKADAVTKTDAENDPALQAARTNAAIQQPVMTGSFFTRPDEEAGAIVTSNEVTVVVQADGSGLFTGRLDMSWDDGSRVVIELSGPFVWTSGSPQVLETVTGTYRSEGFAGVDDVIADTGELSITSVDAGSGSICVPKCYGFTF